MVRGGRLGAGEASGCCVVSSVDTCVFRFFGQAGADFFCRFLGQTEADRDFLFFDRTGDSSVSVGSSSGWKTGSLSSEVDCFLDGGTGMSSAMCVGYFPLSPSGYMGN